MLEKPPWRFCNVCIVHSGRCCASFFCNFVMTLQYSGKYLISRDSSLGHEEVWWIGKVTPKVQNKTMLLFITSAEEG